MILRIWQNLRVPGARGNHYWICVIFEPSGRKVLKTAMILLKLYHPKKKPVLVELSVYTSGRALLVLQGFTATDAPIQMFFSGKALYICVHWVCYNSVRAVRTFHQLKIFHASWNEKIWERSPETGEQLKFYIRHKWDNLPPTKVQQ